MIKDLSIKHLGQLIDLSMKASHYGKAQLCVNELQARLNKVSLVQKPNEILAELPMVETSEPTLEHKPKTLLDVAGPIVGEAPEPISNQPPRDEHGNVTRISTQVGDPGYDPEIHLNAELRILCNGTHIPTAHTADTVAGTVWYYEKNAQGRIKIRVVHGTVEIKGLQ